jgi:recombination protein RecA
MNTQLGYPELTALCGNGGIPPGRMIEIFGEAGTGKTTIALKTIALAQAEGKVCLYIDTEHTFDPNYARAIGIELERCIVQTPMRGIDAFTAIADFIAQNSVDVIILDSIAGLVPEENYSDYLTEWVCAQFYGLVKPLTASKACLICMNQLRVVPGTREETSPGAKALGMTAIIRIKLEKHGKGNVTATVLKNRVAPTAGMEASFKLEE